MKRITAAVLLFAALPALAEDAPKTDAPAAAAAAEAKAAADAVIPAQPKSAPPEVLKTEEPKLEVKPEAKPKAKKSVDPLEAEWTFLKAASGDAALAEAAPAALQTFVGAHLDEAMAPDAQFLEAQLREKAGDHRAALIGYLRVLHESPESSMAVQAKSAFLALADRKLSRKYKPALGELVKAAASDDKAERLAAMLSKISASFADAAYEPAAAEFERFQARFPKYAAMDGVLSDLGWLHEKNEKHPAAVLAFKELIAVYPDSALRAKSYAALGQVYAEGARDYKSAVAAYQDLVAQYPDDPAALGALESTARLFSEKLKQHELAVEIDDKIVKKYPKTSSAVKALRGESDLLRNKLSRSADAVAALRKVPDHAGPAESVDALEDAAQIARRDLKDYKLEIELRRKVAGDYATVKDAADQLFQAGEVAESDLKDASQAAAIYQEVQSKFAGTKPAKKAADRIAKLEKH